MLILGNPKELTYETCVKLAPEFTGANLTIVHTPVEWEPMDIFNLTKTIRKINSKANLESFLVLVSLVSEWLGFLSVLRSKKC